MFITQLMAGTETDNKKILKAGLRARMIVPARPPARLR